MEGVATANGAVSEVATERGEIRTAWVVGAAGRVVGGSRGRSASPCRSVGASARSRERPRRRAVTACAVWAPGVAFRQRRDGSFNLAAGDGLDHDITLDSLRQVRFFLPNYLKNSKCSVPRRAAARAQTCCAALPGSPARRQPLVWRSRHRARAEPDKVARSLAEFGHVPAVVRHLGVDARPGPDTSTPRPIAARARRGGGAARLRARHGFSGHGFAMGPVAGAWSRS